MYDFSSELKTTVGNFESTSALVRCGSSACRWIASVSLVFVTLSIVACRILIVQLYGIPSLKDTILKSHFKM